ncbi:hypothetical protein [Streptomyces orinoci]|uniref:Uncharacterized protein n=1 Tax=Streptomyces orinoci TaxID=67339 RepID=A0ABV3JRB0_STRON|nr:hypothetical protein [Streptomyces orinoci]
MTTEIEWPASEAELVPYLRELLHSAAPILLEGLIEQATVEVPRVFPDVDVIAALRRALS